MSIPNKDHCHPRVTAEATEWFVALQDSGMSREQRDKFVRWLRRSPVHVEEFLGLVALHSDLRLLPEFMTLDVDDLLANFDREDGVIPISPQHALAVENLELPAHEDTKGHAVTVAATQTQNTHRRRAGLGLAVIVAVAVTAVVGGSFEVGRSFSGRERFRTGIGEQLAVSLVDGSHIDLSARSSLSATVNTSVRELQLEDGEALFRVAKNRGHPFRVHTPQATIEATGTQFNIDVSDGATVVSLLEGHVVVTSSASQVSLNPGEQVSIARHDSGPLKPRTVDTKAVIAWTEHRLVFEDAPLSRVVAEFNRYSQFPFIIQDPSLRSVGISGSFGINGAQSFADSISASGTLRITRQETGAYVIERR